MKARIHPSELKDARAHLPVGADPEPYIYRQRNARLRVALSDAFYRRYPSRMGSLHQLAVTGIAIARFAGLSVAYDRIGDMLIPTDHQGRPRTPRWQQYIDAFAKGSPDDVLEEYWLQAHLEDMERVKSQGLVELFAQEFAARGDDPTWRMLDEHMRVTLGTRVNDRAALAGHIALETAISSSLSKVLRRQIQTGLALVRTYVASAARATILGGPWTPQHLPSDRRLVLHLCMATLRCISISRVWKLGRRRRARGAAHPEAEWSLIPALEQVLGPDLKRLDPLVYQLFHQMDTFRMTATVHLYHQFGSTLAWIGMLLTGQGMYEEHLDEVDARFRLFRRDDGSMHFVREFWCADEVRVFDSDFVVRNVDGIPTLLEMFEGIDVAARMRTEVGPDGSLSMTIVGLVIRGLCISPGPLHVRFDTIPQTPDNSETSAASSLFVRGVLELRPTSRGSKWVIRAMGLPQLLGEIRYYAVPTVPAEQAVPSSSD